MEKTWKENVAQLSADPHIKPIKFWQEDFTLATVLTRAQITSLVRGRTVKAASFSPGETLSCKS